MLYGIWNREASVITVVKRIELSSTDSGGGCLYMNLVAAGVVLRGNQNQPRAARFGLLLLRAAAERIQNADDSDIGG
jgi:hypothetical protein